MKLRNYDIGLEIIVEDGLIEKIKKLALVNYPNEFGGLLIGNYSEDKKIALINSIVLAEKYSASQVHFERVLNGMERIFEKLYSDSPAQFYLGEWHTHPNASSTYSGKDFESMQVIAAHPEVTIENPILLIVGLIENNFEFSFYVLIKNKLFRYE